MVTPPGALIRFIAGSAPYPPAGQSTASRPCLALLRRSHRHPEVVRQPSRSDGGRSRPPRPDVSDAGRTGPPPGVPCTRCSQQPGLDGFTRCCRAAPAVDVQALARAQPPVSQTAEEIMPALVIGSPFSSAGGALHGMLCGSEPWFSDRIGQRSLKNHQWPTARPQEAREKPVHQPLVEPPPASPQLVPGGSPAMPLAVSAPRSAARRRPRRHLFPHRSGSEAAPLRRWSADPRTGDRWRSPTPNERHRRPKKLTAQASVLHASCTRQGERPAQNTGRSPTRAMVKRRIERQELGPGVSRSQ